MEIMLARHIFGRGCQVVYPDKRKLRHLRELCDNLPNVGPIAYTSHSIGNLRDPKVPVDLDGPLTTRRSRF